MKHKNFWVYLLVKSLIFLGVFAILHFAYKWLGQPWAAAFTGTDESFFQHLKIGFVDYSLISLVEFFILRKQITSPNGFIFSRMLSAVISPWIMFLTWYIIPAVTKEPLPLGLELSFSFLVTYLLAALLILLERDTEKLAFSKTAKVIIGLLYASSWFLIVKFSFQLPYADFFRPS